MRLRCSKVSVYRLWLLISSHFAFFSNQPKNSFFEIAQSLAPWRDAALPLFRQVSRQKNVRIGFMGMCTHVRLD